HTKPVRFWEELLAEFDAKHPEVIFLAEAFTRPTMMHTLGKVGFHQSYTYFTWRHTPAELQEYVEELAVAAPYMRPSFWPTTHDILTPFMTSGGRRAFALRAILAATLVPTWGIYSGYELVEDVPRPGAQEQIDNEKYEYKPRDFARALADGSSLEPLLTDLNRIRREHPALQSLTNVTFHGADDPQVLVFSKHLDAPASGTGAADTVLVVSLTEHDRDSWTTVHLDLDALAVGESFEVEDLLTGERFTWGSDPYVILHADGRPAHVLRVIHPEEGRHAGVDRSHHAQGHGGPPAHPPPRPTEHPRHRPARRAGADPAQRPRARFGRHRQLPRPALCARSPQLRGRGHRAHPQAVRPCRGSAHARWRSPPHGA